MSGIRPNILSGKWSWCDTVTDYPHQSWCDTVTDHPHQSWCDTVTDHPHQSIKNKCKRGDSFKKNWIMIFTEYRNLRECSILKTLSGIRPSIWSGMWSWCDTVTDYPHQSWCDTVTDNPHQSWCDTVRDHPHQSIPYLNV